MAESEIRIGDLFHSYADFDAKLQLYKESKYVNYYISDCRTLEATRKQCPKLIQKVPPEIKYYCLKLRCIYGGQFRKKKGCTGKLKKSTQKQNCGAFMYLTLDDSANYLTVSKMSEEHNHKIPSFLLNSFRNKRKLEDDTKQPAIDLIDLKPIKMVVPKKVLQSTDKILSLKDLSNVSAAVSGKIETSTSCNLKDMMNLEDVVNELQETHKCCIKLLVDDQQNLVSIFIQDNRMREIYEAYPEVIFTDSTYSLVDMKIPVFIVMIKDGNGHSEMVAIGLLAYEEREALKWFFETFKSLNIVSEKTKIIMTDKNTIERSILREIFPSARLRIYLFHTLSTFNREITCEKMGITPTHRNLLKQIFQLLCSAKTMKEYDKVYQDLKSIAPAAVLEYFNVNWHQIREEWSSIAECNIKTFSNNTNNRLENFNTKLKSVVTHFSTLADFVNNLFIVLRSIRIERDANAAKMLLKMPTRTYTAVEEMYFHILTPYAFKFVKNQLNLSNISQEKGYQVNVMSCNCIFMCSMALPCKHVLGFRAKLGLPLFDEELYDQRWTRQYYLNHQGVMRNDLSENPSIDAVISAKTLSTLQKFQKVSEITNKIAILVSQESEVQFHKKMKFLKTLCDGWRRGKEFALTEIISESCQIDNQFVSEEIEVPSDTLETYF